MTKVKVKININLFLILLIATPFFSQSQNPEIENSVFWKISGNGLKSPSYLFGTIHIIPKEDYFFSKNAEKCFKSCETLILEADMDIPLMKQLEIAKLMIFPDGKTLKDYMTEKQFEDFKTYFLDSFKISKSTFSTIQKIKPIMASALIINDFIEKPVFYEKIFTEKAKKLKISIDFLESIDFQLSLMNNFSCEKQVETMYLKSLHVNPITQFFKMLEEYKNQNLKNLSQLFGSENITENFEQNFLTNRNKNWIEKMPEMMNKNSCFFAVGAGHLTGKNGLILLLRELGYNVTPEK